MIFKIILTGLVLTGLLAGIADTGMAGTWALELEGGAFRVGRADVRIPGDTGDRFSLKNDLDVDDGSYSRARLLYSPAPRHTLLLTVAPFEAKASGQLANDTRFADTVFPADTPIKASYRFNNYRFTYRYLVKETARFSAELGGTLFVRDARIKLETAEASDSDDDLGFVPLFHFRLMYRLNPGWALLLDGDALASPQGRAIDVLTGVEYDLTDGMQIGLGYRILEGGADNDSVYTFALFHHAAATLRWRF